MLHTSGRSERLDVRQTALMADIYSRIAQIERKIKRSRPARGRRLVVIGSTVLVLTALVVIGTSAMRSRFSFNRTLLPQEDDDV